MLLTTLKQKISSLQLEPSGGGCFEVTVDGDLAYSKLKTGEFPDQAKLVRQISRKA